MNVYVENAFLEKRMMSNDYEKQAEKILSLDSNWKNRSEKFKEMTIQIMANSLRYAETHNIKNEEIVNL